MREDFAGAVNGWFELYGRHEASLNLYFNTWAQKNRVSTDIWFLRTVQSLEAFDKEDKPDRAPSGGRSKARGKKSGQVRRSLKKRLESLLAIPYKILETGTTKEEFVKYATWVRNNYSHGDIQDPEDLRRYAADLAKNAKRLELLMHGNLIHALPIPDLRKAQDHGKQDSAAGRIRGIKRREIGKIGGRRLRGGPRRSPDLFDCTDSRAAGRAANLATWCHTHQPRNCQVRHSANV